MSTKTTAQMYAAWEKADAAAVVAKTAAWATVRAVMTLAQAVAAAEAWSSARAARTLAEAASVADAAAEAWATAENQVEVAQAVDKAAREELE